LAADGHKWMCGPEGAAIFFAAKEKLEELDVLEHGWTNIDRRGKFIDCPADLLPDARRFEAGSLNTNGIYGLRASLELLLETGIERIAEYGVALATRFGARLEEVGGRGGAPRRSGAGGRGGSPGG